jgi:hypothetical protein
VSALGILLASWAAWAVDRIPLALLAALALGILLALSAAWAVDRIPLALSAALAADRTPQALSAVSDAATAWGCCASRHGTRGSSLFSKAGA